VKYADYALGQFIQQAQQSAYWQDTLFLIVADHDIRVRGEHLVPIKNFHIPGLILGADLQPKIIKRVCSQIDLPVTLLSLMGIQAEHPMIGQDISQLSDQELSNLQSGRAMMQFNQNYAWMQGEQVVILQAGKAAIYATYSASNKTLSIQNQPEKAHQSLATVALAHALLPSQLYQKQQYDIPLHKHT
jgi:phosphoglycerol transferase MdoB-like AlkP superfamily enzyme